MSKLFSIVFTVALALGVNSAIALPGARLASTALPGTVTALGSPISVQPVAVVELANRSTVFINTCIGITANYFDLCAIRLLPDGQRDLQFGIGGFAVLTRPNVNTVAGKAMAARNGDYLILARGCGVAFCMARMRPDGSLDSNFGTNGWVDFAIGDNFSPIHVLEDSSGRLIVVSWCAADASNPRFCVDRRNADGSPDLSFAPAGHRTYAVSATEFISDAVLDSSDRIVLVGGCPDESDVSCVRRLTSAGSIDVTWSQNGSRRVFLSGLTGAATAVTIDRLGRYLVAGVCWNEDSNVCVVRIDPVTGSRDTQFGNQGQTRIAVATTQPPLLRESGDGNILVTGLMYGLPSPTGYLVRLSSSGAVQLPGSGFKSFSLQDGQSPIKLLASSQILAAGSAYNNVGFTVSRFSDADANTDRTFDHGGKGFSVSGDYYYDLRAPVVAPATDGGWFAAIACGHPRPVQPPAQTAACVVKHTAAGVQDVAFGTNAGWAYVPSTSSGDLLAIAADASGRASILGNCEDPQSAGASRRCVMRLTTEGRVDNSFAVAGAAMLDSTRISRATQIAIDASGRTLVSGLCPDGGVVVPCVMRLLATGVPDANFGNAGLALVRNLPAWHDASANFMWWSWDGKVIALDNGHILIAGNCGNGTRASICLAKLIATGAADAGFGTAGISVIGTESLAEHVRGIEASGAGFVVAADCNGFRACVFRVQSNGAVDAGAFASAPSGILQNGRLLLDSLPNAPDVQFLQLQADGKVLLGGQCSSDSDQICLMRIRADGAQDLAFGASGAIKLDIGYGPDTLGGLVADRNGAIIAVARCVDALGGQLSQAKTSEPCFARLVANAAGFFDIDDDDRLDAATDGALLLRYMFDVRGEALVTGATGGRATRKNAVDIAAYLGAVSTIYPACSANVVGAPNGPHAMIDGLVLLRVMLGLSGQAVTGGIAFPGSTLRSTWPDIRSHLNINCGMNLN